MMKHQKSEEPPISEDLKALHREAKTSYSLQCYRGTDVFPLIERIGRVEHERNQLRATRLEDGLTIANQRTLLDKYDADNTALIAREGELNSQVVRLIADKQGLLEENAKLKAQVERLQRPFTELEAKEPWPNASIAEAGLANAMLLSRIGWKKWTKESVQLSV